MYNEKLLFKRKIIVLIVSLIVLVCLLVVAEWANREIKIEDPKLEEVIREKLEKPEGPIYQSELSNIISLDASNRGITNLSGIERVYRLAEINLENNKVEDLTPLSKLKMLKVLNISGNGIADLEEVNLGSLSKTQLRELKMRNNAKSLEDNSVYESSSVIVLSDIQEIGKLRALEELDLRDNDIKDIAPISNLKSLTKLNIRGNDVRSLEPISKLKRIEYLNIHSNECIESIEPLKKLVNLDTLIMKNVNIDNINVFNNFEKLQNLNVINCGLNTANTAVIANLLKSGALQGDVRPEYLKHTLDAPIFSYIGGFYDEEIELRLNSSVEKATIYYTIDGSVPTSDSLKYNNENPIKIKENSKATTISAKVISDDGKSLSATVANTYFISKDDDYNSVLPIISIVTDEKNLFDEDIGIYNEKNMNNRGSEWERPIHIEFFETDGQRKIAQNAGVRIHGGGSRVFPQKSLRLYTDDNYSNTGALKYDVFEGTAKTSTGEIKNSFKRLLLRNSGSDWVCTTMFRDALMQSIASQLNSMDTQAYRPAVVYINGEYWGIHNIRERYDEYYLASTYNVNPKDIVILEAKAKLSKGKKSDANHYKKMINYIEKNSLVDNKDYNYIKTQMDVNNYQDYMIVQTYFSNTDWPHNNIKFWRYKTDKYNPNAPYGQDGRWRWMLYDTDYGFGAFSQTPNHLDRYGNVRDKTHNTISWITTERDGENYKYIWPNFLFRALIENESFKMDFINRYADFLNVYANPELVLERIDQMQSAIEPEMARHLNRWGIADPTDDSWSTVKSMDEWYENIDIMKDFAIYRPEYIRKYLIEEFELDGTYSLNLESNSKSGYVKINSVDIKTLKWQGVYFKNIPLALEAFNSEGSFSHWEIDGKIYKSKKITVSPEKDITIKAVFKN